MFIGLPRSRCRLAFVAAAALAHGLAADEPVEAVQRAASEWARLRSEAVHLRRAWDEQRETLDASVVALQARLTTLTQERDALDAELRTASIHFEELEPRNAEAHAALDTAAQRLERLAQALVALRPFLPPRLSSGLELPYRSLQDPALGPAERTQHIITILNRCTAFNRVYTFGEAEIRAEDTAETRLFEVLYAGLSHAYALDRARGVALFGHPGETGWVWESRPEAADATARLIAVFQEKRDPAVQFAPVRISDPLPVAQTAP